MTAAGSNVADQHITAFGHSYGSLVTSLALQQGAPVSDVVLYGSPGTELTNASQLGVQPGHAYYMIGVNDDVSQVIPEFGAFGAAPQDVPGMTELSTSTGLALGSRYGDGNLHERAYGHSEYARMGSNGELRMSGYTMAAVLAGLPDDLITPRAVGVDRLPGGAGPYEVPPPIPRQHVRTGHTVMPQPDYSASRYCSPAASNPIRWIRTPTQAVASWIAYSRSSTNDPTWRRSSSSSPTSMPPSGR
ncbi:hypothetical protein LAUMK136_04416 [Mycobacterium attenuatum]|uniref:DUF1023 domain-containing protein n=2 Tax=Mycobacterium attenuatum TaxID=2341086 RepID=A0A498Q9S6_9MYCO|nr:hypothetical protein LAUMK136_04416 [Mycobacterium attenuatum]